MSSSFESFFMWRWSPDELFRHTCEQLDVIKNLEIQPQSQQAKDLDKRLVGLCIAQQRSIIPASATLNSPPVTVYVQYWGCSELVPIVDFYNALGWILSIILRISRRNLHSSAIEIGVRYEHLCLRAGTVLDYNQEDHSPRTPTITFVAWRVDATDRNAAYCILGCSLPNPQKFTRRDRQTPKVQGCNIRHEAVISNSNIQDTTQYGYCAETNFFHKCHSECQIQGPRYRHDEDWPCIHCEQEYELHRAAVIHGGSQGAMPEVRNILPASMCFFSWYIRRPRQTSSRSVR